MSAREGYEALLGMAGWGIRDTGDGTFVVDAFDEEEEAWEAFDYVRQLQRATLQAFGYEISADAAVGWHEVDATVDQAVEWIDHGCGSGDFAGCRDPETAWD